MSNFTEPLRVDFVGRLWATSRELRFFAECDPDPDGPCDTPLPDRCGVLHIVPEGYLFDGASIPRFLWSIVGHPAGPYAQAAALHDKLYRNGGVVDVLRKTPGGWIPDEVEMTRAECDALFLYAMQKLPAVTKWERRTLYAGVRVGGWLFFKRAKRAAARAKRAAARGETVPLKSGEEVAP